jgi:hypothetical protein
MRTAAPRSVTTAPDTKGPLAHRAELDAASAGSTLGDVPIHGTTLARVAVQVPQFSVVWRDRSASIAPVTRSAQLLLLGESGARLRTLLGAVASQAAADATPGEPIGLQGITLSATPTQFAAALTLTDVSANIVGRRATGGQLAQRVRENLRDANIGSGRTFGWMDLAPEMSRLVLASARTGAPPTMTGSLGSWSPRDLAHDLVHEAEHSVEHSTGDPKFEALPHAKEWMADGAPSDPEGWRYTFLDEATADVLSTWAGVQDAFGARAGWKTPLTGVDHDDARFYGPWSDGLAHLLAYAGIDKAQATDRPKALDLLLHRSIVDVSDRLVAEIVAAHPGVSGLEDAAHAAVYGPWNRDAQAALDRLLSD